MATWRQQVVAGVVHECLTHPCGTSTLVCKARGLVKDAAISLTLSAVTSHCSVSTPFLPNYLSVLTQQTCEGLLLWTETVCLQGMPWFWAIFTYAAGNREMRLLRSPVLWACLCTSKQKDVLKSQKKSSLQEQGSWKDALSRRRLTNMRKKGKASSNSCWFNIFSWYLCWQSRRCRQHFLCFEISLRKTFEHQSRNQKIKLGRPSQTL